MNQVTLQVQKQLESRRLAPLGKTPRILIVDGVWVEIQYTGDDFKLDRAGHLRQTRQAEERVILAALAVWEDGSYEMLHYEIATAEGQAEWETFWEHLIERGLQAEAVEVVVSDGCLGLPKAMKKALPQAQQQRCITVRLSALRLELRSKAHVEAHKVRGLDRYLSYQHLAETNEPRDKLKPEKAKRQRRFEMQSDAYKIFKAETEAQAGSPVCLVENGGDADSFSSFIVLKASNSKDFTIHQVCLSPEVQESPQAQQDYGSLSRNGKH